MDVGGRFCPESRRDAAVYSRWAKEDDTYYVATISWKVLFVKGGTPFFELKDFAEIAPIDDDRCCCEA